jgi:hypothetical protein
MAMVVSAGPSRSRETGQDRVVHPKRILLPAWSRRTGTHYEIGALFLHTADKRLQRRTGRHLQAAARIDHVDQIPVLGYGNWFTATAGYFVHERQSRPVNPKHGNIAAVRLRQIGVSDLAESERTPGIPRGQ